jgi:hypothetical protein
MNGIDNLADIAAPTISHQPDGVQRRSLFFNASVSPSAIDSLTPRLGGAAAFRGQFPKTPTQDDDLFNCLELLGSEYRSIRVQEDPKIVSCAVILVVRGDYFLR